MPGGDRTGPFGAGPMTGRGAGYCGGFDRPGWANPVGGRMGFGRGFGRGAGGGWGWGRGRGGWGGWGRGGGWGWGPWTAPVPGDEREALRREAEALEKGLDAVRRRLEELDTAQNGD